ncbi:MAG: diguanylate cyclase [Rhodanobacteraceae bacterium]
MLLILCTPDRTAEELIRRLHDHPADVPVVAVGSAAKTDGIGMIEAGADDWLAMDSMDAAQLARSLSHAMARRLARDTTRANGDALRVLFDQNPYPVLIHARDSQRLLAANQAASGLYGYSDDEWPTMSLDDIRHPEDAHRLRELMSAAAPVCAHLGIWRHCPRDGSTVFVDIHCSELVFHGIPARLSQMRDVTLERRAIHAMEASERRYRDLFEQSLGYICTHDMDGQILSINSAAAESLGYRVADLLGHFLVEFMPAGLQARCAEYLEAIRSSGGDRGLMMLLHRDGSQRAWQYHNRLHTEDDGSTIVVGYAQDITEQRAAQRALRRNERRMITITDALPLRVAYIDRELRFEFVNSAYEMTMQRSREKIVGCRVADVLGVDAYAQREPYLRRALAGEQVSFQNESGSGTEYRCDEFTCLPEFSEDQRHVVGIHVMIQDVTASKREEQRLTALVYRDELTGLMNRKGFFERLRYAVDRSAAQNSVLALMYLDVDGFKQINDRHGHAVGDLLLTAFARRLEQCLRVSDSISRLGGDEFTVIMEGVSQREVVTATTDRIVRAMREPFSLSDHDNPQTLRISASVGIAFHDDVSESSAALLQRADAMLYAAKRGGRDRWCMTSTDDVVRNGPGLDSTAKPGERSGS